MNKLINGLEKYKVAVLAALVVIVLTAVVSTVVIGGVHIVIALAGAATSPFRHFTNATGVTHSHFRPFITTTFGHSTITTGNATATSTSTRTPIKHIIVIFQENNSFDHYFGTYPQATNPPNEPSFIAAQGTPTVNNLLMKNLLPPNNPNLSQPHRIDRSNPVTCNPLHDYTDEQKSYNGGKTNLFVQNDGKAPGCQKTPTDNQVMDYYDGNTVTAVWNYAQHFAMSDNFHGSTFGPSTPGHINLVCGNTHGAFCVDVNGNKLDDCTEGRYAGVVGNTLIADIDPTYDICSEAPSAGSTTTSPVYQVEMTGKNIGDLLTAYGP
jgi:phospholipase C